MSRTALTLATTTTTILALTFTLACGAKKHADARPPAPVTVAEARRQSMPIEIESVGTVVPITSVAVAPRVAGQLQRVLFEEGTIVKAGDLLFEIDPAPYLAALAEAEGVAHKDEATRVAAVADAARWSAMLERHLVAPSDADAKTAAAGAAKAAVEADRGAVESAKLNLAWTRVTSPISGRCDRRQIDAGNLVTAGTPVVVVRQMTPIEVVFSLPQERLAEVQEQMHVRRVEALALPVHKQGFLSFLGGAINPSTGTEPAKARFDNDDAALWPGAWVRVRLHIATAENAVVVPSAALQNGPRGPFVFVVAADGTAALRPVKPGPRAGDETAIETGVEAGEHVIVDGQIGVAPGAHVTVVQPAAAADPTPRTPP